MKMNNPKHSIFSMLLTILVISGFLTTVQATNNSPFSSLATPVLNFSDIDSGPKTGLNDGLGEGAIITIWGQNLGDTQETSKIYIDNIEAAHIYYWGKADGSTVAGPSDLSTYHKMQTISFSIPSTVSDGQVFIHVEIDGQVSETLPFTIRSGDIFFVKPNGTNGTSIDGSWNTPWATLDYVALGSSNLGAGGRFKPGDIVYATDGVLETSGLYVKHIHGTAELPLSIIAYPGAEVIVEDSGMRGIHNWNGMASYWNFSKLIVKTNGNGINGFKGMRAIANEITNYPNGCADGQGGAIAGSNLNGPYFAGGGIKMLGNYVHDFGCDETSKLHHVFYISNRGGTMIESFEIGWNHVSDTKVHHALHVYDEGPCGNFSGTMRIHDNVVINQVGHGINISAGGSSETCFDMPIEIYNNLIVNSGLEIPTSAGHTRAIAITRSNNKADVKLYNNTFYGYGEPGDGHGMRIQGSGSASWVFGGTWEFINNIFVDTNNLPFEIPQYWDAPDVGHNNLWYSSSGQTLPSWNMNSVSTDPQFVNPVIGGNFALSETSPAVNVGADTRGIVSRDLAGFVRNNGSISIGAYEINSTTQIQYTLTANATGNGSVSGAGDYDDGTTATLTATPDTGWQFDSWSGDLSGSNNTETITMDGDKTVTATFSEIPTTQYTLTANTSGNGNVSGADDYDDGTTATLTATPDTGWQFDSWSGDLSGSNNPETITMDGNKTVTATFSEIPTAQYTLTANTSGNGNVSGAGDYDDGTTATLTATPDTGWQFDSWSGDLSGSNNPETITMDGNKMATATFIIDIVTAISIDEASDAAISISPNPTSGSFNINLGDDVLIYAAIFNASEQKIKETTVNEVDISNMANGVYFVKIFLESGKTATKKVIKK